MFFFLQKQLEDYLNKLLRMEMYRKYYATVSSHLILESRPWWNLRWVIFNEAAAWGSILQMEPVCPVRVNAQLFLSAQCYFNSFNQEHTEFSLSLFSNSPSSSLIPSEGQYSWGFGVTSFNWSCVSVSLVLSRIVSLFQMEFIDISQLSFIQDLGPKGL